MKMTQYDRPMETGRKTPPPGRAGDADSIAAKCRAVGTKTPPGTIISRMKRHGISFEEALAWKPASGAEIGRKGKVCSHWKKVSPNSKLDRQIAEGNTERRY